MPPTFCIINSNFFFLDNLITTTTAKKGRDGNKYTEHLTFIAAIIYEEQKYFFGFIINTMSSLLTTHTCQNNIQQFIWFYCVPVFLSFLQKTKSVFYVPLRKALSSLRLKQHDVCVVSLW